MSKLSAKLTKVAQKGVGSIQNAWLMIGKEMEADGQAHRCIANSLEDEIVKPIKNLQETHCRIKKTVECDVSKTSEYLLYLYAYKVYGINYIISSFYCCYFISVTNL